MTLRQHKAAARQGFQRRPFRRGWSRAGRAAPSALAAVAVSLALVALPLGGSALAATGTGSVTYYVLADQFQGQPEFLFEIAQRFLGDGNRAGEIFNLNKGRRQPNGEVVTDPNSLRPGWVLVLPDGATGVALSHGPLPDLGAQAGSSGESGAYYVVTDRSQGQPEFLFEIAQRFLGDGNRAGEIFNLNKGRRQPDGQRVSDPARIAPGWVLRLPDDARGRDVLHGVLPSFGGVSPTPQQTGPAGTSAGNGPSNGTGGLHVPIAVWWVTAAVVALGLIGGGWSLLRRRLGGRLRGRFGGRFGVRFRLARRPRRPAGAPAMAGDWAATWAVDRSLRSLLTACRTADRVPPPLHTVLVGTDTVRLGLATPDEDPPEGWQAAEGGRIWSASLRQLPAAPVDETLPDPYPCLVTLGGIAAGRLLADLGQVQGLVSLEGDAGVRREVALGWVRELVNGPRAEGVHVVGVGLEGLEPAGGTSLAGPADLPELAAVERGVLFTGGMPAGREGERLAGLAGNPASGWVVVVVGEVREARWRLVCGADGVMETGLLDEPVRLPAAPDVIDIAR
jgi:hypothetical protein